MSLPEPYYRDEHATIYHGDCREILPYIEADVVVTDPPYGVAFRGESWDREIPEIATRLPSMFPSCLIVTAPTTLWDYPRPDCLLAWTRPGSTSRTKLGTFNHWSPVLVYGKHAPNPDTLRLPGCGYTPGANTHPCPKPERLMSWLVNATEGTVLDPFAGSGTTLRAAKDLGRRSIGCEIEERYCEIAANRLRQGVLWG